MKENNPEGVKDFGVNDDVTVAYKRDNNFYYIPNSILKCQKPKPLNAENHPLSDGKFSEAR
jgi:hypothetical protein